MAGGRRPGSPGPKMEAGAPPPHHHHHHFKSWDGFGQQLMKCYYFCLNIQKYVDGMLQCYESLTIDAGTRHRSRMPLSPPPPPHHHRDGRHRSGWAAPAASMHPPRRAPLTEQRRHFCGGYPSGVASGATARRSPLLTVAGDRRRRAELKV